MPRIISLVFLLVIILSGNVEAVEKSPFLSPGDYFKLIKQRIDLFTIYPVRAKANTWEGTAEIKFIVKKGGKIENIEIEKSSGYPLLDKAAVWAVKSASNIPPPILLQKAEVATVIPIEFVLKTARNVPLKANITPPSPAAKQPENARNKSLLTEEKEILDFSEPNQEELQGFVQTAIENNMPLKIAGEEKELASIKVKETKRNLYPAAKVGIYNTTGEVYEIGYEEREAKVEIAQPLYYGGRLKNALKQAEVNMEITERSYDEQKIEIIHKTEVAYYTLCALRMNLDEQKELLANAEKILEIVKKQYDSRLITGLECNGSISWHQQLSFQIKSIEQELRMAELSFKQVVDTEEIPQIQRYSLEAKEFDINLTNCINLALKHRPEILIGQLSLKFNEYNKEIEKGKNRFTVDLTTSCGFYQGAYETEPMTSATNWYIGIKATKPWGANTLSAVTSTQTAEPRFGESSPTQSTTISNEFSILDNFRLLEDKKQTEIAFLKSENQLNEAEKGIIFEVQDAFLSYKKALFQLKSTLSQKKFREEEVKILKIKASMGESNFSAVMESLFNLSGAKNNYMHALSNYYISLSNLKKATGYGIAVFNNLSS